MKILLLKTNLLEALNIVDKAVESGTNLPILKNIQLVVGEDSKITFTSTNLELAIKHTTSGKVIKKGTTTIPFEVFNNIIRNLNSEKIGLEQKNKVLVVNADNYEAFINCEDSKEFPIIPSIKNTTKILKLKKIELRKSLAQTIIATQYSEIRPEINGIYFSYNHNSQCLVFAGTDSFRLVEKTLGRNKILSTLEEDINFIVPLKTVEDLLKILDNEDDVEIFIDPNQILFKTPNTSVISRLIDGGFPDYKTVLPKESQREICADRNELINAVKITKTFSGRANDVVFKIGDNRKILEVYSIDPVLGENSYRVPIKIKGKGDKLSISFNWRYVLDGLRVYNGEEIVLGITSAEKPVLIKGINEPELIYVVMPIKS